MGLLKNKKRINYTLKNYIFSFVIPQEITMGPDEIYSHRSAPYPPKI
jgi:hypothetical protein